ncbi:hypothetical protein Q7I25_13020, partial [Aeromonas hydrophila]
MSDRTASARWRWLRQHIKILRNAELEPEEKGTTWRFAGLIVAAILYGDGIHLTVAHKREWSYGFKPDNKT